MAHFSKHKHGYTLLFAVMVATLVLGVTVFILSVSRKQFILSSTARESMFSYYAADSGMECMASDPSRLSTTSPAADPEEVECNGVEVRKPFIVYNDPVHGETYESTFNFGFKDENNDPTKPYGCALMKVTGYTVVKPGGAHLKSIIIESRGYNLCTHSIINGNSVYTPDTSSPHTVERALELGYEGAYPP